MRELEHRQESQDGTVIRTDFLTQAGVKLAIHSVGDGPPIVLANGLGGTFNTWRHVLAHYRDRYRIVSWDYRGLYGSAHCDGANLHLGSHVDDLEAVLDHFRIERALFVGWSMGVQVNFELYRRRPSAFAGLAAMNGTAGRPFDTVAGQRALRWLVPPLLRTMQRGASLITPATRWLTAQPGFLAALKRFGVVAPQLDEDLFRELAADFGGLDFNVYLEILRLLGDHDAWDLLGHIKVPVTIITATHDFMTPVRTAVRMSQRIPDARLVVVPDCTHYAAAEKPALINAALDDLIARCPRW